MFKLCQQSSFVFGGKSKNMDNGRYQQQRMYKEWLFHMPFNINFYKDNYDLYKKLNSHLHIFI